MDTSALFHTVARGFFNDFDIADSPETRAQPFETIQSFVRDGDFPEPEPSWVGPCINKARHLVHVLASLPDVEQSPEWKFVEESPIWRGKKELRW